MVPGFSLQKACVFKSALGGWLPGFTSRHMIAGEFSYLTTSCFSLHIYKMQARFWVLMYKKAVPRLSFAFVSSASISPFFCCCCCCLFCHIIPISPPWGNQPQCMWLQWGIHAPAFKSEQLTKPAFFCVLDHNDGFQGGFTTQACLIRGWSVDVCWSRQEEGFLISMAAPDSCKCKPGAASIHFATGGRITLRMWRPREKVQQREEESETVLVTAFCILDPALPEAGSSCEIPSTVPFLLRSVWAEFLSLATKRLNYLPPSTWVLLTSILAIKPWQCLKSSSWQLFFYFYNQHLLQETSTGMYPTGL